jgi:hypothetical protein
MRVILMSHTYNKEGEMESESTLTFMFRKNKKGETVLYGVLLAG